MNGLLKTYYLIRCLGLPWVLVRAFHAFKMRTGWFERTTPPGLWSDYPPERILGNGLSAARLRGEIAASPAALHFASGVPGRVPQHVVFRDVKAAAGKTIKGIFTFFGAHEFQLQSPPDWFYDPFTKTRFPSTGHWSRIDDFAFGDIKPVWDLNRFGCVYSLVRAYITSPDDRYPELFWMLIGDWAEKNPPNTGVNWKCGQEISFRIMAWSFGLHAFIGHSSSTDERVALLLSMIAVSGDRIEKNIGYALSQRNNHGISEAAGLYTLGLLYPQLKQADSWKQKGKRLLEKQLPHLIYRDGGFSQHSAMYHRLLLQVSLRVLWLAQLYNDRFARAVMNRIRTAVGFAATLAEEESGTLPIYGHSDGSDILPLTSCGYPDFRPVLQALYILLYKQRYFPSGPWDEIVFMLFGEKPLGATCAVKKTGSLHADISGVYTLEGKSSRAILRCPSFFHHRPAHADLLHMDLRYGGYPVCIDPGTCSYNAPDPWNHPLAETRYHNTVLIDDRDQMERAGRFLWLPWPRSSPAVRTHSANSHMERISAAHGGYRRLKDPVRHSRHVVRLPDDVWLVIDDCIGKQHHTARLHWLFDDYAYQRNGRTIALTAADFSCFCTCLTWNADSVIDLVRADESSPRGWKAHAYLRKEPALSFTCEQTGSHAQFVTIFDPEEGAVRCEDHDDIVYRRSDWTLTLHRRLHAGFTVTLSGGRADTLELAA